MDSKRVAAEIKVRIHPLLKEGGFTKFTAKRAWRPAAHAVAVVYFQSFSPQLASGLGCTTYSLALQCGIYYPCVHWLSSPPTEAPAFPDESVCQARLSLAKTLTQKECARPDVWYVRPDGSNLQEAVVDVRRAITEQALPWLSLLSDPVKAYDAFKRSPDSERESLGGSPGSMARDRVLRGLRLAIDFERHGAERGFDRPSRP